MQNVQNVKINKKTTRHGLPLARTARVVPISNYKLLKFREPAHHFRRRSGTIHHSTLMNEDRRAFLCIRKV